MICMLLITSAPTVCTATTRPLDTPVEISIVDREHEALVGRITAYDAERFMLDDKQGVQCEVAWSALPARTVFSTYQARDGHGRGAALAGTGRAADADARRCGVG